jgi:homoserine O-acetyltransferase
MPPAGWTPSAAQRILQIATPATPFITERCDLLSDVALAYETWGELSAAADNVVLVLHALTGDAHAASHPDIPGDRLGWWEPLIGPGRPIDTNHWFVICANGIGSCYGSTGPRSLSPAGRRYNLTFPALTVRDLVTAQLRLLDALGIEQVACVIGGSLGGMQALELPLMAPERTRRAIVLAASGRFHAQGIAYNEIQRRALMLDPAWCGGDYEDGAEPTQGVAVARMLGMVTYQSDAGMTARFDRNSARYAAWPEFQERFDVEGYLHYQGDKLAQRFDANTYLYLSRAMDTHDIGRDRGGLQCAARSLTAETLLIGVSSDILFPADHVAETTRVLRCAGARAQYWELDSIHGHDAFLKEFERMEAVLRDGLGQPASMVQDDGPRELAVA